MNEDQIAMLDAEEVKQLLDNKHLKRAFLKLSEHLEHGALSCDPDNKEQTQRVIIAKQLLASLKREFERVIENGEVAQIRIRELEKQRKWMPRVLQR